VQPGDCADNAKATAAEIAAIMNRDTGTHLKWYADKWGQLWFESLACGPQGLEYGNETVSVSAGNLSTATGFTGLNAQTYAETAVQKYTNGIVSPNATGNGSANFANANLNIDFDPGQLRDPAGVWVKVKKFRRSFIASGMPVDSDWGEHARS
jgi:hypothetical protein